MRMRSGPLLLLLLLVAASADEAIKTDATKWYDPRTWLNLATGPGDGTWCPLRVAHEAGHADVVAFLAELLPDVDPATGKRRTKEL